MCAPHQAYVIKMCPRRACVSGQAVPESALLIAAVSEINVPRPPHSADMKNKEAIAAQLCLSSGLAHTMLVSAAASAAAEASSNYRVPKHRPLSSHKPLRPQTTRAMDIEPPAIMKIQLMVGLSHGWKATFRVLPSSRATAAKGAVAAATAAAAGDARSTTPATSTWVGLGCGKKAVELAHEAINIAMASNAMPRAFEARR
mmetsp:Transcript_9011/g.22701  ORF Transcript_9011/g.22701 Transcript_9011/m.22701 type:complete len:201 (+) Transcript_9011:47-649(+)